MEVCKASLTKAEVAEDIVETDHHTDNKSQDDVSECEPEDESGTEEVPDLTSDEEGWPMRSTREPERLSNHIFNLKAVSTLQVQP